MAWETREHQGRLTCMEVSANSVATCPVVCRSSDHGIGRYKPHRFLLQDSFFPVFSPWVAATARPLLRYMFPVSPFLIPRYVAHPTSVCTSGDTQFNSFFVANVSICVSCFSNVCKSIWLSVHLERLFDALQRLLLVLLVVD